MKKTFSKINSVISFLLRHQNCVIIFFAVVFLLFISVDSFARMGGAGGSSSDSSSGGGDGLAELIFLIIMLIPFPYNLIIICVLIVLSYLFKKFGHQKSILNKIPSHKTVARRDENGIKLLELTYPNFNEVDFLEKVSKSFFDIQKAWSEKNIGIVRRYISDGMYQRVITQFKMMDLLGQKNTIKDLSLINVVIDKVETDNVYDIVHVRVFASIYDTFMTERFPQLNKSTHEEFIEYWTFIRKNTAIGEKDMFNTYNCPNCGGNLEDTNMGDMCKCPYCDTITNSGEYDWVLSKITQADDYVTTEALHNLSHNLVEKAEALSHSETDFSTQILEDKASNGYLQLATAKASGEYDAIKRFVTDDFYQKFVSENSDVHFIYERIFLNDVTTIAIAQNGNQYQVFLAVKSSSKRLMIQEDGKIRMIDYAIISKNEVLVMSKDVDSSTNKGSIYALQCSTCGGTLSDTTDVHCPYCSSQINSTKNEWIISNLFSEEAYYSYYAENAQDFIADIKPSKVDSLYKVRDYAFNNILIMAAADGVIDDSELEMINKLAKKWGYAPDKLEGLIEIAKNKHLVIRMPSNRKDIEKIYKLMVKVASIDGHIDTAEEEILRTVREEYMQN